MPKLNSAFFVIKKEIYEKNYSFIITADYE